MPRHPNFNSTFRTGLCALAVAVLLSPLMPVAAHAATTTVAISSGVNDAEEMGNGHILLTDSDLDMGYYQGKRIVALRYILNVPKGAKISNASLQFKAANATSAKLVLAIRAQDSDNASAFTTRSRDLSSRTKTSAVVKWTVPSWKSVGHRNPDQTTPNIKSVLQEVVNRSGWKSGNAVVILLSHDSGTARRIAMASEASTSISPELKVTYSGSSASGSGSEEVPPDDVDLTPSTGNSGGINPAVLNAAQRALKDRMITSISSALKSKKSLWMDPTAMALSGDTYRYARMLNEHITSLTASYRATGDKRFAAEIDRLMELTRKKLSDSNKDGYRNWIYTLAPDPTDKQFKGTDKHVMDELMSHAMVAGAAYTLKQAGYKDHARFWTDYLTKDFEPKWRKRTGVKSKSQAFISKGLTHPWIQSIRLYYYMGKLTGDQNYINVARSRAATLHNHFKPVTVNGKQGVVWAHFIQPGGGGCVPNVYVGLTLSGLGDLYTLNAGLVQESDMKKVATTIGGLFLKDNISTSSDNCGGKSMAGLKPMLSYGVGNLTDFSAIGMLGKLDATGRTKAIIQKVATSKKTSTGVGANAALLLMSK